jgi:site-specific recombinase XerD
MPKMIVLGGFYMVNCSHSAGKCMKKINHKTSNSAKRPKPPIKPKNKERRSREYLTDKEIERLRIAAKKSSRHGLRDEVLILLMFRHALRMGELIVLRWDQVDLKNGLLHVHRIKNGLPSTHPLRSIELRMLRQLKRSYEGSPYVFISQRGTPLATRTVHEIIARAGKNAEFEFTIHPHMLRHSTGFYLANKGFDTRAIQAYMGHSNIMHTVRYTELAPHRFKDFWKD